MDYSLAALKLLCCQLKHAREVPSQNSFTLGGILFQRAWLQVSISLHHHHSPNAAVLTFSFLFPPLIKCLNLRVFWCPPPPPTAAALFFSTTEPAWSSSLSPATSASANGKLVNSRSLLSLHCPKPKLFSLFCLLVCAHCVIQLNVGFCQKRYLLLLSSNCLCILIIYLFVYWQGMYVMVVGGYVARAGEPPVIKVKCTPCSINYKTIVIIIHLVENVQYCC